MFHFRLQSVLNVRERLARLREKEYGEALAERQALQNERSGQQNALQRAAQQQDDIRRSGQSVAMLPLYENYRRRVHGEMERLDTQLYEQAQALEVRRHAMVEAKRDQRTLEILRDKEEARYDEDMSRRERALMDEVASTYHQYRRN